MKTIKNLKLAALVALAALAVTLLFQTATTQAGNKGQRGNQDQRDAADLPLPVAIYDTFKLTTPTTPGFAVSFAGVVTVIIGTDVLTGTSRMDVYNVTEDIAYCKFTWVIPGEGTLVTSSSVCKIAGANGIGAWSIEKGTGTGIFKHFKAVGTETFGAIPATDPAFALGFTDFERFAGVGTFDKHGHDKNGDD